MTSEDPLKVGLVLPMFSAAFHTPLAAAMEAESLGFDGVFGFDHLLPLHGPPDGPAFECFSTLAAVGAVTSRVAVGTLVARVALRTPGLLAKMAAGLDHVSAGRAIIGLGTGDRTSNPEHRAFGFPVEPPERRTLRLEETAVAVRALLAGRPYEGGRLVPSLDGPVTPPPATPDGPPLWVGGLSDRVIDVAARKADGWNGWGLPLDGFASKVRLLYESAGAAGRAGRVEATWGGIALAGTDERDADRLAAARAARSLDPPAFTGTAERLAEHLAALREAGATWTILLLAGGPDRRALVAERVLPLLRS